MVNLVIPLYGENIKTKIHLVSARHTNAGWGFGNDVHDALVDLGIDIIDTDFRIEREKLPLLLNQPCDLMLVLKGEWIPPELIRDAPCKSVLWYPDDLIVTEHAKEQVAYNGNAFDIVYGINNWDLGEYAKLGVDAKWLPLACNPKLHRKLGLEKRYDVSFVGSLYPVRKIWLERLSESFDVHYERAYGEDMVRVFNESKVVLNLAVGGLFAGGLPHRIYEALACGSLLFTNELPVDEGLFVDGKHLVCYHNANMKRLLAYYLSHENEREAIAEAGRKEVLAKHTVRHRVEQILKDGGLA